MKVSMNEFHINKRVRDYADFPKSLFESSGNYIFANFDNVLSFQKKINAYIHKKKNKDLNLSAGDLYAMGLIDEISHYICYLYRKEKDENSFLNTLNTLREKFSPEIIKESELDFLEEFPSADVYRGKISAEEFLKEKAKEIETDRERGNDEQIFEELIMLHLENENPAFKPFKILFDDTGLTLNKYYPQIWKATKETFEKNQKFGPFNHTLIEMLKEPVVAYPTSLKKQLEYIKEHWGYLLSDKFMKALLLGIDTITEEEKAFWAPPNANGSLPDMQPYSYENLMKEYERFSPDKSWMPNVVLMAKTVLVWLDQLSKKYSREIKYLNEIPDEELDALKDAGFTGLWLIGLWERSYASKRIKQINGNPEAAASAYSLFDYEIAGNLGGWQALENLRYRCWIRGIRLASDMVPNHTGMDGKWVVEHPDYFISSKTCPFPQYTFSGENLSTDGRISIYLEDHYYSKTDCAVCYKRVDNQTGDVTYIYHGNDGTGMAWNDTAQIDFLNPTAREAVIQQILKVAHNFPIIRFDAAMVLAKKHIRRLWYPEPGHGGDIASRSRYAMSTQQFEDALPNEFWREVVDRCAKEIPDTLLLAEAFWMMEGYFTRTLGMHRVYNSAFMNMLKKEENQKYRDTVKNTINFNPQVLKRFVNFMNNPDEETAVAQFGKGDKYFGVCTLMVTMPGLPMFGHGQIEGFEEKYGMEYTKAYRNETPDQYLVDRHKREIFPLMHKRYIFSEVENFLFYDVWDNGVVNENIFAYSNRCNDEKALVFYNNKYERAQGWIKTSCSYACKTGPNDNDIKLETKTLAEGLNLSGKKENHFLLFREKRSDLEYIRPCEDIINNGMYVALNGFETQIYMDIREVEDTADKKYAKLNEMLKGAGTKDLEIYWQEIHYKELYDALKDVINPDSIAVLNSVKESLNHFIPKKKQIPDFVYMADYMDYIHDKAVKFFEVQNKFAKEDDLPADETKATSKANTKTKASDKYKDPEEIFARYKLLLTVFYSRFVHLYNLRSTVDPRQITRPKNLFNSMHEEILNSINNVHILIPFLYLFASYVPDNYLKFGYERKLLELLDMEEFNNDEFKLAVKQGIICLGLNKKCKTIKTDLIILKPIINHLFNSPYSYLLTGDHTYNGERWVIKETIEMAIKMIYLVTLKSQYNSSVPETIYKLLMFNLEKSEYHSEKFIELCLHSIYRKRKVFTTLDNDEETEPKQKTKKAPAKKKSPGRPKKAKEDSQS